MAWPTPQDYNEAVQNPHLNFRDPELRSGSMEVTPMGLPRVASGAFASVYRMHTPRRDVAVRCFLHNVSDQQARYSAISKFLSADQLDCTVDFDYLPDGVRVGGYWYPLLKMEWASGRPLDEWVRAHLQNSVAVGKLCDGFKDTLCQMRADGIAHGDLQHGNLLIQDDLSIRLVDYDGMFVPALAGLECPEIGHRNYQHPGRTKDDFGPYLDNFAAWSIYVSLFSLSRDASLMQAVLGGDEALLFRQFDYKNPTRSRAFAVLEEHSDREIVDLARKFRGMLALSPQAVPYLNEMVPPPTSLPELEVRRKRKATTLSVDLPAWMIEGENLPAWMIESLVDEDDAAAIPEDEEVDIRESIGFDTRKMMAAGAGAPWPTLTQYTKAITVPAASFSDPELQMCRAVRVDGRVLVERSQQNAVFQLQRGARSLAIKVFLSPDDTRAQRYNDLIRFLQTPRALQSELLQYVPRIEYVEQGIRIDGCMYPIVKMDWIQGTTLDRLEAGATQIGRLDSARHQFRRLVQAMEACGFVHGELEPANIIVSTEGLKLVDFDGARVPNAQAPPAVSQGHLRHPRESHNVDVYSDCFPAWVIDTALIVLREQPELRLAKPPGQFIFQHDDFLFPQNSDIFRTMSDSKNSIVHQRYELLQTFIRMEPYRLPLLKTDGSIDRSFARNHGLNFPELSPGRVSPDVVLMPPSVAATGSALQKADASTQIATTDQAVHKVGGFVLLFITIGLLSHSGIIPALPFFCFFLIWAALFGPKKGG